MSSIFTNARQLRGPRARRFGRHYLEMVVVMLVSMMVFAPVWELAFRALGDSDLLDRADLSVVTMATSMTVGMALWMSWRGHGRRPVTEMAAAMYLPFPVLLGPLWAGVLTEEGVLGAGHVLMLLAMAVVMLLRPEEYAVCHGSGGSTRTASGAITSDAQFAPTDPSAAQQGNHVTARTARMARMART